MFDNIINSISKNVVGNEFKIKISIATIISGGHILIEDLPGTGKTTFAKSLTEALNLNFKRIQFTSDLLPSDILGYTYLKNNKFETNKGPIFTNIVLADELNRASPKTQSAFLEAMEEGTVTIDKKTFKLQKPFSVIATQNPSDLSGTSLLPESQLDRFSISFSLDELDHSQRLKVLSDKKFFKEIKNKSFKFNKIKSLSKIYTNEDVIEYLDKIHQHIKSNYSNVHISIRSLKHTIQLSKALALINGKEYVTFQEIKDVLPYILRHRLSIVEKNDTVQFIKNEILSKVHVPNEV
ncbi:AAA family ATPase [Candidatus Pelagibacter sp. HIMB1587]|uniref:AAA family ATPase n=1 Tax=Candidatus Pelagibacter sp. HIMB1587 TaxID=3413354 RepID=UPI003F83227A